MEIGKLYIQAQRSCDIYVMPTRLMKNGGFYGLIYRDYWTGRYGGKVTKGSLAHMNPAPVPADNAPDKVIQKFNQKEE